MAATDVIERERVTTKFMSADNPYLMPYPARPPEYEAYENALANTKSIRSQTEQAADILLRAAQLQQQAYDASLEETQRQIEAVAIADVTRRRAKAHAIADADRLHREAVEMAELADLARRRRAAHELAAAQAAKEAEAALEAWMAASSASRWRGSSLIRGLREWTALVSDKHRRLRIARAAVVAIWMRHLQWGFSSWRRIAKRRNDARLWRGLAAGAWRGSSMRGFWRAWRAAVVIWHREAFELARRRFARLADSLLTLRRLEWRRLSSNRYWQKALAEHGGKNWYRKRLLNWISAEGINDEYVKPSTGRRSWLADEHAPLLQHIALVATSKVDALSADEELPPAPPSPPSPTPPSPSTPYRKKVLEWAAID